MKPESTLNYEIWSDGGMLSNKKASAASIIRVTSINNDSLVSKRRIKLVTILDPCPPSDAELIGIILGLATVSVLSPNNKSVIDWYCDHQPIIQVANKYLSQWQSLPWGYTSDKDLKSKHLWQIFYELAQNAAISSHHTPAHCGIYNNEACDKACRWISKYGDKLLSSTGTGPIGRIANFDTKNAWNLLDCRPLLVADLLPSSCSKNLCDYLQIFLL